MSLVSYLATTLGLLTLGARNVLSQDTSLPVCVAYGMDFQNGGSYFQNSLSSENFGFVSQYDGCQNDIAYNILVDPSGDQTLCSNTQLQPDDTDQLSTCPIMKSQLFSGDWSVVVITNNGDGTQAAYERDFALSVGPQSTITFTPTVTATVESTAVATSTSTVQETIITVLDPSTVTSPSTTVTPTKTKTPPPVFTTTTKALLTVKLTKYSATVIQTTKTKTAVCKKPTRQAKRDPTATIKVTVGPAATILSHKFRRETEEQKRRFVEARAERMALNRRAPDPQPLVVTDMNTADYPTSTTTSIATTITATIQTTVLTTATSTPPPITVVTGKATAKVVTTTAPAKTHTLTKWTIATSVTTKVFNYRVTVTTTTTPAAVATACKKAGGILT